MANENRNAPRSAGQSGKQKPDNKKAEVKRTTAKKAPAKKRYNGQKRAQKAPQKKTSPLKIAFLGGLNEVGKNMTLFEYEGDMFLVDCGLAFPDNDMPGVDLVLPDFSYVIKNADKIKGIVITHGHEDHIGGLAYLLKEVNIPVYTTKLTNGLIRGKLKEHRILRTAKLKEIKPGDEIQLGKFKVEFIHVNHSIPDACALAIKTGAGTVIHTGDFKIDATPIAGGMINLARFAQLGEEGVLALMMDSTNAERPGYALSESKVGESFETLFRKARNRRIIVATFASNVHRVQQIMDVSRSLGRKVAVMGRSLENVVQIGQELGYLKVPENTLIPSQTLKNYPPEKTVIITTGSQGEPMSALTRMAFSDHKKVEIAPGDFVIISATPIPGNEKTVGKVVNELLKLDAEVVYEKMYEVHVSGHACQEELKMMMSLIKPKYFIPVHGEQKHLRKHAGLAEMMGIPKKNIMLAENGDVLALTEQSIKKAEKVQAGRVFVDGSGVGDVGNIVLKDRKHLAEDGLIIVAATVDSSTGEVVAGPEVVSRGFVYVRESEELMRLAKRLAESDLEDYRKAHDANATKAKIRDDISRLMYDKTRRSPMILPVLMEV